MSEAQANAVKAIIEKIYDARRRENVDEVLAYFDAGATFRVVANSELGELSHKQCGHVELRPAFEALFQTWDWTKFLIKEIVVEGDSVVVHSSGELRHTPSDTVVPFEILDIMQMKNGKIHEFTEFLDTHLLQKLAGKTA